MAGYPNMNPNQQFYNQGPSRPSSNSNSPMPMSQQYMPSNGQPQFTAQQLQQFAEFQRQQGMGNNIPIQLQQQMQRQGSPQIQQQGVRPPIQRTPSQQMIQQMYQQQQQQQQQNFQPMQQPMRSVPAPPQPRPTGAGGLPNLTPEQMMAIVQNPELFQQLGAAGRAALETMIRNSQSGNAPRPDQQRLSQGQPQAQARRGSSHSPQIPYQHFNQGMQYDGQSPPPPYSSPRIEEPTSSPQMQMQQLQQANRPMNLSTAGMQAAQTRAANRPIPAPTSASGQASQFRPAAPRPNPLSNAQSDAKAAMSTSRLPPPPSTVTPKPTLPLGQIPSVLAETKTAPSGANTPSSVWESTSNSAMKRRPSNDGSDRPKKKVTVAEPPKPQVFFTAVDPSPKPEVVAPRPLAPVAPMAPRPVVRERLVDFQERRVRGAEGIRGTMRNELSRLMYAAGDATEPDGESVDLMEDMVADFLADLCRPVPPMRSDQNAPHQPIVLTGPIIRHRLASHPSMRKYLDRFDIMNHLAGELARNKRIINQTESHFDLVDQVGKDYLGITDDDLKKTRKRGTARKPGATGSDEVKRKPGPKKGWKIAQKEALGKDEATGRKRKGFSKERSGSVGVKRQSESPAP